jgi:3-isopropylmalate/(R)-2-methylmalate dehydratase small subunit
MSTPRWIALQSHAALIARDDIDTDQIIPARFLTTTSRNGLGVYCFADWRYSADGKPRAEFPLNQPVASDAQILVAGHNFGCGSSREHAPWSLLDAGFRAIVAGSFADIFRNNAHKNGLLTVALGDAISELHDDLRRNSALTISIDLGAQRVSWSPDTEYPTDHPFEIEPLSKRSLMEGLDELGLLVAELSGIAEWERATGRVIA